MRIALIPVYLLCYLAWQGNIGMWAALVVFVAAAVSDWADGHIARARGIVTNFGKLMDPLADKALVASAMIAMTAHGEIPVWATVAVICREFFVSGFRQLALEQGKDKVIAASSSAKVKTVLQMVMIIYILAKSALLDWLVERFFADIDMIGWSLEIISHVLIYAVVLLTVFSAIEYVMKNKLKWG